jgi:D-xylose reductase
LQNLDITSFKLSDADMKAVSGLNLNLRMNNPVDIDPRLAIFA